MARYDVSFSYYIDSDDELLGQDVAFTMQEKIFDVMNLVWDVVALDALTITRGE